MSFVTAQPELLSEAARELASIGSMVGTESSAAAPSTTGIAPAAADEVSAMTASQFAAHAHMYQTVIAQAMAVHEQFVSTLGLSANSYATAEAANAAAAG